MELNPFDPLFRIPFLAGLLAALALSLLGAFLRLREEWLAALGLAHLAAGGGLAGMAVGLPVAAGGAVAGIAAASAKALLGSRGNTAYALMILLGWSLTLLLAANSRLGESLAHALVDGQLYFAGAWELIGLAVLVLATALTLPWLARRLLRARFFPLYERANRLPAWRWHLVFDLLVAIGIALGTATMGLMAAFACAFVPAWLAFRGAGSWRQTLILAPVFGGLAYLAAFLLALAWDQPFGPVMVAVLLFEAPLVLGGFRLRGRVRGGVAAGKKPSERRLDPGQ